MSLTYFIQMDGPDKLVKIGRTENPRSRLTQLSVGGPWALNIVALVGSNVEKELHREFANSRAGKEWFHPSVAMNEWLGDACARGVLVKQKAVDDAYINAVIKPRIKEYLNGRPPANTRGGDFVTRILCDELPALKGREKDLIDATKGHVTLAMCRGFCPTNEVPVLDIPLANPASSEAAA